MENPKKKKSRVPFWLILIIISVTDGKVGAVILSIVDLDKYFPKEDIYQSFSYEEISNLI